MDESKEDADTLVSAPSDVVASKHARSSSKSKSHDNDEDKKRLAQARRQYDRGKVIKPRQVRDKKLRGNLKALEERNRDAVLRAKDAEILLENDGGFLEAEEELERTYKIRQADIKKDVAIETAKKGFELKLEGLGPYGAKYTRNGRELLLFGRKGHAATTDWRNGSLGCELQLGETIRDAVWLHNNQYFATAQKKHVYIYDRAGVEVHKLSNHIEASHMEFLPYHFLLATVGTAGYLKYTDTSTGANIAEIPTKTGTPTSMCQNPWNAIIHTGHQNGQVQLWSPNSSTPHVKLLAHRGAVRSLAVDRQGYYMVSAGQDLRMAVWDIRMFKEVNNYFLRQPGTSISISDRGLTAVGWGTQVSIWKHLFDKNLSDQEQVKIQSPYMGWGGEGQHIQTLQFCPFEDVLGIGHDKGFSSVIVPGAGEPNYDALEVNPYETKNQRQEAEVKSLLDKLQPDMISLNPEFVGNVDRASHDQRQQEKDLDFDPAKAAAQKLERLKSKGRGKNNALRKLMRKQRQSNVVDEKRLRVEQAFKEHRNKEKQEVARQREEYGPALARFAGKGG